MPAYQNSHFIAAIIIFAVNIAASQPVLLAPKNLKLISRLDKLSYILTVSPVLRKKKILPRLLEPYHNAGMLLGRFNEPADIAGFDWSNSVVWRSDMKYTMIRLAIAILLGAVVGNSANAGFGSHGGLFSGASGGSSGGGTYGSAGGYGSSGGTSYSGYGSSGGSYVASYGSSGGASSGGSSGRPGLLSRLHTSVHSHIAAKHARRAAYGSSGGSSGGYAGYGSSGGYYSGYSSSGGGSSGSASYGSTGSVGYGSTGSVSYGSTDYGSTGSMIHSGYGSAGSSAVPAPAYYGTSTTSPTTASGLVSNSRAVDDSVKLNVSVPESAKVYVNDRLTTSTGEVRQFVSRGLEAGRSYRFEVRAELNDNGKIVTDTQSIVVRAGAQENVRFEMQAAPKADAKVDTAVVLNVPENAEVTLAGNQTQVKGTTRVFKTSQLKAGDVWDEYVIQVKVGEQVKTQSIRLIAGDKLELSFEFDDANRLAAK